MYITSIELENIKSYVTATINLSRGTNAISGFNGSGKTTILEAIGFALFDSLPYKQDAFVRAGAKTGTVRVRVEARDEREYEVVRQVGARSQHYVFDLQLKEKVVERGPNVIEWVRTNLLGLDESTDLRFLFENAIGVPQGTMATGFLLPARQRKDTFNRLLGVEEYERAWEHLRDTVRTVENRIANATADIRGLEGETERVPIVRQAVVDHSDMLAAARRELDEVREASDLANGRLQQCEQRARALDEARHAVEVRRREMSRCSRDLATARQDEFVVMEAVAIVEENRAGHAAHVAARTALEALEPKMTERDCLLEDLHACRRDLHASAAWMQALQGQIEAAEVADRDARDLFPHVEEQARLEIELQQARTAADRVTGLEGDIDRVRHKESRARERVAALAAEIEELERASAALPDVNALQDIVADLQARYREAVTARDRLPELQAKRDKSANRVAALECQVESLRPCVAGLDALSALAERVPDLEAAMQATRSEQQRLSLSIEYQQISRSQLLAHRCPLLAVTCPASGDEGWIAAQFDRELETLTAAFETATLQLAESDAALIEARRAVVQAHEVEVQLARLQHVESALEDARAALRDAAAEFDANTALTATLDAIVSKGKEARSALDEARALRERVAGLDDRRQQRDEHVAQLEELVAEIARRERELGPLQVHAAREAELAAALTALGNPRRRYDELQGLARERRQLEARLAEAEAQRGELSRRETDVERRLEPYAELDAHLARHRAERDEHAAAYETYVRHVCDAERLEECRAAVLVATEALTEATTALDRAEAELMQLADAYDADEHQRARARYEQLTARTGTLEERARATAADLEDAESELRALERVVERLEGMRGELSSLERTLRDVKAIRDLIRAAAPAVTESLLGSISFAANEIFSDIIDDHAGELRLDTDYDIVLQRGAEERRFAQFSGGEQMSAALAVRLALIKQVSDVGVAFFDEPTQNMDALRRSNLAAQIENVKGFEQILVISHDDSFEEHTDHLIRLQKAHDATRVEVA